MNVFLNINYLAQTKILPCDVYLNDKVCYHTRKSGTAYKFCFEDEQIKVEHLVSIDAHKDNCLTIPYCEIEKVEYKVVRTAYGSLYGTRYTIMLDMILHIKNKSSYHFETYAFELADEMKKLYTSKNIAIIDKMHIIDEVKGKILDDIQKHYLDIYDNLVKAKGLTSLRLTDERG